MGTSREAKECPRCQTVKAPGDFYNGDPRCKDCHRDRQSQMKYGIGLNEIKLMEEQQGGVCALCRTTPGSRGLFVDHCHETGVVRGLLCNRCNSAVGVLGDTEKSMERVLRYMKGEEWD